MNMNKSSNRINQLTNLAIVLVVLMIGVVIVKNYFLSPRPVPAVRDYRVSPGARVSLPGTDWAGNGQTLVLVLQKGCRYCTESAPFYRQLAKEATLNNKVRLLAVLPQEVGEGKEYLNALEVPISEVRQADLDALGVQGTPTLILVNADGRVLESWAGKLPPEQEQAVIKRIEARAS
jgi:hypothetical protein